MKFRLELGHVPMLCSWRPPLRVPGQPPLVQLWRRARTNEGCHPKHVPSRQRRCSPCPDPGPRSYEFRASKPLTSGLTMRSCRTQFLARLCDVVHSSLRNRLFFQVKNVSSTDPPSTHWAPPPAAKLRHPEQFPPCTSVLRHRQASHQIVALVREFLLAVAQSIHHCIDKRFSACAGCKDIAFKGQTVALQAARLTSRAQAAHSSRGQSDRDKE